MSNDCLRIVNDQLGKQDDEDNLEDCQDREVEIPAPLVVVSHGDLCVGQVTDMMRASQDILYYGT